MSGSASGSGKSRHRHRAGGGGVSEMMMNLDQFDSQPFTLSRREHNAFPHF